MQVRASVFAKSMEKSAKSGDFYNPRKLLCSFSHFTNGYPA
jgi:hypothetical protein